MYLVFIHCSLHLPKSYYNLLYKKNKKSNIIEYKSYTRKKIFFPNK